MTASRILDLPPPPESVPLCSLYTDSLNTTKMELQHRLQDREIILLACAIMQTSLFQITFLSFVLPGSDGFDRETGPTPSI
ncbi:hypothetical protein RvY_02137-2 [Ramazzottius varieornatus]|uniref:Uncharacterized protein n=1 Tax=Ramazzottius varieornatus TaxID=947166 RepID=A0A1D1UIP6_RAMVA|nr:hypothetical protein RvY_02137-2 [Ramazzottius varieornatus]